MKALFQNIAQSINQVVRDHRAIEIKQLRREYRALERLSGLFARTDNAVITATAQGGNYPVCLHSNDDLHLCGLLAMSSGHDYCEVHQFPQSFAILEKSLGYDTDHIHRGAISLRSEMRDHMPTVKARLKALKLNK